uniref:Rab-GAP TBC domain-containing protein n=1 Tax=Globisporangium ultimum (strain ATCC 200006 / CBS 805.95 / DAOM BR144) TaxID=431595 RepID=K3WHP6_GLOUD
MLVPPKATSSGEIAQRWMEMVLGEKFQSEFTVVLRSGVALCDLANRVFKALGMKDKVVAFDEHASDDGEMDGGIDAMVYVSNRPPRGATQNIRAYLSACELLGVSAEDMFEPDDLLQYRNIDKVYRNILALQIVAVSLSTRRSIDDRSSLGAKPIFSPISDPGGITFLHDDGVDSPSLIDLVQHQSWPQLLFEYEYQQLKQEEQNKSNDPSATEGLGKLAHDIWGTEERIRALLMNEDHELGLVPDDLHGKLWMLASGAELEMRRHKGQYQRLVDMEAESTEATRQIDVDLYRTVSKTDKTLWNEDKTQQMRRVLVAYSYYNPTLGYCQGLNYIVARILLFLDEEEAFYLLIKMIRLVPEDYYTSMLGLAVDQHVFTDLVRIQTPDITEHLTDLGGSGVELSLACTEWFLTLFASPCDKEVTVRIWDSIFLLGDEMLFRVALALMQLEKSTLINCKNYGDMLKHLNEIGRENTDASDLLRLSRDQDCVYRARIEDFRAHHRLQLASGIVASAVESEDATVTSSTGRPSTENKAESRIRQIGKAAKRHSIFKHLDRNAGRESKTFDRYITDDFSAMLQKEHPNFACYYDGAPPMVFDRYWGSKESYNQWGTRHVKHIALGPEEDLGLERWRLQSDAPSFHTNRRLATSSVSEIPIPGRGLPRERRSKSTAFIQTKKSGQGTPGSSGVTHTLSQSGTNEDVSQYGRSPRTWIQKIEDWHKEMKIQKEKKKAEKKLRQGQRSDSVFSSSATRGSQMSQLDERGSSTVRRHRKSFSSSPPRSHHKGGLRDTASMENLHSPVDRLASSVGPRKKGKDLSEVPLARSFSDPFHSPNGVLHGRSPWQQQQQKKPSRRDIQAEIDAQIVMRSQDPYNEDFKRGDDERISDYGAERGRSRREQSSHNRASNGSNGAAHRHSDYSATSRASIQSSTSSISYAPVPASAAARSTTTEEKMLQRRRSNNDIRRPPLQHPKASSSNSSYSKVPPPPPSESEYSVSPVFSQLRNSNSNSTTYQDEEYDAMKSPYMQPIMRRNMSMPAVENLQPSGSASHKWMLRTVGTKRPPTAADSARVIRDRAHVVSYLQRKLSDASSLAGSISRSPRGDRMDVTRLSGSSSGSSRTSDIFGSNRSAVLTKPYRKGSFSFFDKLSSDLESCLDDLNTSYLDDSDLASDVGSSTLPLPTKNGGASALDEWRRRSSFAAYRS